ncbi:MAG: hypothetical protein JW981_06345, partial [Anaerolineae bacterium]|nr:hypothetical protein [Anaerolineae bacterium]
MTKKFISNSWRILLAILVLGFGLTLSPQIVRAEGSGQTELDQPLLCYYSGRTVPIPTFYVDILTAGEVINVSLDTGSFSIYDPAGNLEVEDQAGGQVAADAAFDGPITTAYKFTTDEVGTWKVVLDRYQEDNNCLYKRFDISVTPSTAVNPDPRVAAGRVYNYHWAFNAGSFADTAATDADYYILVPGGRPNKDYVWQLDLNNFAGYVYELIANDLGVDAPNSGYSVPKTGNSWTEKFPMYVGYPV